MVTLARSVANLSSEIRSQQVLVQEVEALKAEMHQLRMSQPNSNSISSRNPSQSHPNLQFDSGRNKFHVSLKYRVLLSFQSCKF